MVEVVAGGIQKQGGVLLVLFASILEVGDGFIWNLISVTTFKYREPRYCPASDKVEI